MTRVLITGLSGVGKSSVLAALAARGFAVADTDYGGLSCFDDTGDWVWDLDQVRQVLGAPDEVIFISGTARNWRPLLPRFDHIVLLSAPSEVMITRLAGRTNNPYGQTAERGPKPLRTRKPLNHYCAASQRSRSTPGRPWTRWSRQFLITSSRTSRPPGIRCGWPPA